MMPYSKDDRDQEAMDQGDDEWHCAEVVCRPRDETDRKYRRNRPGESWSTKCAVQLKCSSSQNWSLSENEWGDLDDSLQAN